MRRLSAWSETFYSLPLFVTRHKLTNSVALTKKCLKSGLLGTLNEQLAFFTCTDILYVAAFERFCCICDTSKNTICSVFFLIKYYMWYLGRYEYGPLQYKK